MPLVGRGDFNTIVDEVEKLGGLPVTQEETIDFMSCISKCALNKLKFIGSNYTWWNGRIEEEYIFKRLDRVFGNSEFVQLLPNSEVHIQLEICHSKENKLELNRVEVDLKRYLHLVEEYWKQKTGIRWFKDGDRNTKFFHSYVKERRTKMQLSEIQTMQGDMVSTT